MSNMIEASGLTKKFGGLTAVDNISFNVEKGEIFGLLGPNGAGKSTTLSMLCTILRPTSGTAIVNGYDVVRQPSQVRKSIGIVFQDPSIDDKLTGRENLVMHGDLYGVPRSSMKERIDSVLNSLENFGVIMTFVNMPMFFLSGALFPVATLPDWLKWAFYFNPLTYGVDALRAVTMGSEWPTILPLWQLVLVIIAFDIVMVAVGSYAFTRTR